MSKDLSISDIQRFAGLEGIRKRPTIYIGPTDSSGLWVLPRECLDNTVDRALANQNDYTHFIEDTDRSLWVIDRGPGIPVEEAQFHDEHGRTESLSGLYVVTGMLHAGSNFDSATTSRGTHGIGQKATNALSSSFSCYTYRNDAWHSIHYKAGRVYSKVTKENPPALPFDIPMVNRGTIFHFTPDLSLFDRGVRLEPKLIEQWFTLTSYLVPGLDLYWTNAKGETRHFEPKGVRGFLDERLSGLKASSMGEPFIFASAHCDVALSFTSAEGDNLSTYTNGLHNAEGGEHGRAVYAALQKALIPYKGKLDYALADLKDGIVGLVNAKLAAPKFNNQPKDKLVDSRIHQPIFDDLYPALVSFFKTNSHLAKDVTKKAASLHTLTAKHRMDRKLVSNVKKAARETAHGKLAAVVGSVPMHEREIFLVEGECLVGETLVTIRKDSRTYATPIKALAEMKSLGIPLPHVRAISPKGKKEWVPIADVWETRQTASLLKVTLSSDGTQQDIICTPNHPFLLADSQTYTRADALTRTHRVKTTTKDPAFVEFVTPLSLPTPVPVFDLTVDGPYPNFLLDCGVFVHNSASGSGKKARDKSRQAIYALKGKPLNVMDAAMSKIQANKEIIGLLSHLEIDLDKPNTPTKYGKIIFAVDGDIDGDHIATLLMGLFWRFCPALFRQGKIYKVESPHYKCTTSKGTFFGNDKMALRRTHGQSADITLLKGLGECNPSDLWTAILNPETRTLTRITYPSRSDIAKFESLLGKDVTFRKDLLNLSRNESPTSSEGQGAEVQP